MSGDTFNANVIVVKKTKLGESDLILRMLGEDGSLVEAIAKGARKPGSALSGRLEIFNCASLLLARGRNLHIVKESKLLWASDLLHKDPEYMASAAIVAEYVAKTAQESLEQPRIFELTKTALQAISESPRNLLPLMDAAYLLKAASIMGARPSFSQCAICGDPIDLEGSFNFSFEDGGSICDACGRFATSPDSSKKLVLWGHVLLHSKFKDIASQESDMATSVEVLQFAYTWVRTHFSCRLKSVPSLISYCSI